MLHRLAEGRRIEEAASDLDVPVESAREILLKIADQYVPSGTKNGSRSSSAVAFIDGGSRGNPGPAGCGVILQDPTGETLVATARYLGEATNNVAEYSGLILALEKALEMEIGQLEIRSDSKLLIEQMVGNYKVKSRNLIPLFIKAQTLARRLKNVVYTHVPRDRNREADRLANEAMDSGAKQRDG